MPRTRTVKDPVQKGRITIGQARSAARVVRERQIPAAAQVPSARSIPQRPKGPKRPKP